MSDWSSGYNVDVGYTYGFYKELSPHWLNCVATLRGVAAPYGDKLRYLELGCGYGLGLILLAAIHPEHEFLGIDFNPVHIVHGRKLAAEAGLTNIRFEEADFVELAQDWPREWGQFDYVVGHGIYSWLDFPVREAVVKTIKHATNLGAIVYLSYNTMPGCVSMQPVQHLLRLWQTTEHMGSVTAITEGVKRLKAFTGAQSTMSVALPTIKSRVESMDGKDIDYLVHEYLHDNWHPIWFDQMADQLRTAKLSYVGTASVGDLFVESVLPQAQKDILAQYEDPITRQVMIDVLVNRTFRRDVFARGATQMWSAVKQKALLDMAFVLLNRPENDAFKFKLSVGKVTVKGETYKLLLDALANGQRTVRELVEATGKSLNETVQAMTMLMHGGHVALHKPIANRKAAKALNRVIIDHAAQGAPYKYLIAPETGAVFGATDVNLIMAHELLSDTSVKDPSKLAEKLVTRLLGLGKALVKDGQPLNTRDTMLPHATTSAEAFLGKTLIAWKKLDAV